MLRVPAASDPASGSVSDQHPIHSPVASFGMYLAPLLIVTGCENVIRAERVMSRDDQTYGWIDAREFFNDDGVIDVAEARASEFFREDAPRNPSSPHFLITSSGKI